MLISLEHRYYGKSMPVSDLTTENMKYCNHNQALADLANFVDMQGKAMNLTEEKWITFGGSYPGMMAGWARLKFPTAIYASVASSAPVQAQVNSNKKKCFFLIQESHFHLSEVLHTLPPSPRTYVFLLALDNNACPIRVAARGNQYQKISALRGGVLFFFFSNF